MATIVFQDVSLNFSFVNTNILGHYDAQNQYFRQTGMAKNIKW